jgi:two-component system cell cycle sensor histidine kinase/response regulator CckA
MLLCVLAATAGAYAVPDQVPRLMLTTAAAGLLTVLVGAQVAAWSARRAARRRMAVVMEFLQHDSAPGFCIDDLGEIFAQNRAARDRFGRREGATMPQVFEQIFANPDAVVHRLLTVVQTCDSAREDVMTRRGHVRVAVHRIPGGTLWRLEDLVERAPRSADGIGLPVLTFGSSGTVLYMNGVLRGMIGRRAKRLEDVFETVPIHSGQENRLRTRDGPQPVRLALSQPVNGRQEVFVLPAEVVRDDRVALEALPVALLRLDRRGTVLFANRPARALLPGAAQDGARLSYLVEGLGRTIGDWIAEAAEGRSLDKPEIVRVSDAAVETFLQITLGRPLGGEEGGIVAVLSDATELKTLEAQFVQSQKMQAIGQLAGGVAHDFNNLLTAISGHCDLLLLRHREGDEDYGDLMQIIQNANRAASLVGQLLAFSRKQTLKMTRVDLRDTLGDLIHLLNRLVGDRVRLRLEHDPALVPIRCDRRQLEQVLMNLVVNARDAMPDGGTITIETRCITLDAPMLRDRATVPPGRYVVVSVQDEGVGIAPDKMRRIFEPFFTTKRPGEGTGLGLSMAYGIVKQSGGFLFADSVEGEGATFELFFHEAGPDPEPDLLPPPDAPVAASGLPPIPEALPLPEPRVGGPSAQSATGETPRPAVEQAVARVLDATAPECVGTDPSDMSRASGTKSAQAQAPVVMLVEDEAPVRSFASRALQLRGYSVLEMSCAEEALEALRDESLEVDLFITDIMMPGMDGPSWVRRALESRPGVRTVFMSGYSKDALVRNGSPVPNSVFLAKPFSLSDFTKTVEAVLS